MGHYAFLDDHHIVTEVITGKDEGDLGPDGEVRDWEIWYGNFRGKACKKTSYNTRGGVHYDPTTGEPSADQSKAFRKNYAGLGYSYDPARDAFIPPQPFHSWALNEQTCLWDAPTPYPADGERYTWNEDDLAWVAVP